MGVTNLQRVEGPLHQIEAAGDGVVALGELEATANAGVAVLRQDGEHVRVEVGFAVPVAGQRHGETYQGVAVECPDHLAANALRHHEDTPWDDVAVAVAPDLKLQNDATLKVFEAGKGLDANVGLRAGFHGLGGSLAAFLAWFHSKSSSEGVEAARASVLPAADSIATKRRRNFALVARKADSGSTLR